MTAPNGIMPQMANDAPASPSVDDLINSMALGPSTNQWDIICSYSLDKLNKILEDTYNSSGSGIAKEVKISTLRNDPLTGTNFTIDYDIIFGAPSLEFTAGVNGMCNLSMEILSGTYTVTPEGSTPGKARTIPDKKYSVTGDFPLVAVYGDQHQTAESGTVIVFSPQKSDTAHITLHFSQTSSAAWGISPSPEPGDKDPLETYFLPVLDQYFRDNIKEIDYTLTSLSNELQQTTLNEIIIEPLAFVFATSGDKTNGILSLYIQTANSGNEKGNLTPSFQPGDKATLPIPQGHHASLILSRDFLQQVYIIPQLQNTKFINLTKSVAPISTTNSGCTVKGAYNSNQHMGSSLADFGFDQVDFDPVNFDYTTAPFTFCFSQNLLNIKMLMTVSIPWTSSTVTPYGPMEGPSGTASVTISLNKNFDLPSICKLTDQDISMSFSLASSDYTVSIQPGTDDSCWNSRMGSKVTSGVSSKIGGIIPPIKFSLSGINFFKETNLLFPGKKVLSFDSTIGIHIPCDLILVGDFL